MFNEEWELLTEPLLMNSVPMLSLSGIALQEDQYSDKRDKFWRQFDRRFVRRDAKETVYELVDGIKTPEQPEPDMRDPATFAKEFEEANRDMELKYTRAVMDGFYEIIDDLQHLHERESDQPFEF